MRHFSLKFLLAVVGGLLVYSQALAGAGGAPTGEQLRQWHQAQQMTENQLQVQQLTTEQIKELQNSLATLGYHVDGINGVLDDATRSAISNFQHEKGLTVTGRPTDETMQAMEMEMEFFGLSPEFGNPTYDNTGCCP